jgi:transcriptional regulator with XRE-family HTH domain
MDSVFQELKRARENKRLSVNDIADATLINPRFLEAIEEGRTDILPQTYVRAFIREYASVVNLDPAEVMRHYDQQMNSTPPQVAPEPPPRERPSSPVQENPRIEVPEYAQTESAGIGRFALPVALLITLGIVIWNVTRTTAPQETKEIPFESVLQEHRPDTISSAGPPTVQLPARNKTDSLHLFATFIDSAWVQITIDSLAPKEYLFKPNSQFSWRAKDRFRLTTGNAGAVDITLNDRHLGVPGKIGAVARNVEFSRKTLKQK